MVNNSQGNTNDKARYEKKTWAPVSKRVPWNNRDLSHLGIRHTFIHTQICCLVRFEAMRRARSCPHFLSPKQALSTVPEDVVASALTSSALTALHAVLPADSCPQNSLVCGAASSPAT